MAKKSTTNIVEVWNKTAPVLESGDFNANEQLTLIHTLIALNRNVWEPTKINPAIIAAATGKDKRTIAAALQKLINNGILSRDQRGGIFIGEYYQPEGRASEQGRTYGAIQEEDTDRTNSGGNGPADKAKPAHRKRSIFNDTSV